jgi:homoserine dehydrogenase
MSAEVFVLGKGTVGGALLDRLAAGRHRLRVIGIADSTRACFGPLRRAWRATLAASCDRFDPACLPAGSILVDCTASDALAPLYTAALRRGVHVVSANKKPFAGSGRVHRALHDAARISGATLAYETTVGAALPVLGPLRDLVRVGDEIHEIEACLSGTLGFLSHRLDAGTPLATAVAEAQALGYTEPDPNDDLSGADVARKAIILARAIGLRVEPSDVALTPFAPIGRRRRGRVLRYVASLSRERIVVGPRWLTPDHPAAQLRGTDSLVVVRSALYSPSPLRIQGPGAGGDITAGGVLADVLEVASSAPHRRRTIDLAA